MRLLIPHRLTCLILLALLGLPGSVFARYFSATPGGAPSFVPALGADSTSFEGMRIDSVAVETRNVFNTAESRYNNVLFRTANKLHVVSRAHVIRREILLKTGDQFTWLLAEETARNLRTRYDLYDAWVIPEKLPSGGLLLRVITQDQWSLLIGARIRRDANMLDYQFSIEDRNLFGRNQFLSFDYHRQENDENYVAARFRDLRIWGLPYMLEVGASSEPTNKYTNASLSHPYYNLSQRVSYMFAWEDDGGRIDYYRDSARIARTHLDGDRLELSGRYRWGSYNRKLGVLGGYQYQYRRFYDQEGTDFVFPRDSLFHFVYGGATYDNIVYRQVRQVNGFSYTEDVTLGQSFQAQYGRPFRARFTGFVFDQAKLIGTAGFLAGKNLFLGSAEGTAWYRAGATIRQAVSTSVRYYNTDVTFMTVAARVAYKYDSGSDQYEPLYLGGTSGIRGYRQYYLTGNSVGLANLELRFFPQLEFLSVMLGGAVFADIGQTWKNGNPNGRSGSGGSLGIGLRVSPEKASKLDIFRLDLARTRDDRWEFSFGTGQYF
jgi:outer membrane protein assembly factor BamA